MTVIRRGRRALVGVVLAVTAGSASFGAVAMTSGQASIANTAVTLPTTLTNDPGATLGGVDFFDASGAQITTGPLTAPFAAFAVAQTAPATAQTPQKAALYAYTPVLGQAPGNWSGSQIHHATSVYPVSAPADLAGLPSATVVYTGTTQDTSLTTYSTTDFPNTDTSTSDGYAGIYTIRVVDINGDYAKADILIDTTAHTWTQEDGQFTPPGSGSGPTATTTALTVDHPSPVSAATSVTFTATVTPSASGTVEFLDGTTALSSAVPVTGGVATYTTSTLSSGTHSITAAFTPTVATAFGPSTSTALSYIVNASGAATTTTALASIPGGPVTSGTPVTFTASIMPSAAPGSVQFMDGSTAFGDPVTVASGTASLAWSSLSVDTHSITAVFTSSNPSGFGSSTSPPLSFQVTAATGTGATATATTLGASPPSPITTGTATTFTATVTPSAAGSVQFMDGTTALGSPVAVTTGASNATAASAPVTLPVGSHPITAIFTPTTSTAFSGSTSSSLSYVVNAAGTGATATATTLGASPPSPIATGTATTFTATVTPSAAGSVQFMDGTTALGSPVAVTTGASNATAASAPVTLPVGSHPITAVFTPTTSTAFSGSTSSSLSYTVNAAGTPLTTTTTVTSSVPSPTTTGTSVTFTATLTPNTAAGTVQFMNGTTAMGSPVAVSSGTATYTTSFGAAATYPITAVFTPTSATAFVASTSSAISYVVTGATVTSTALAVSPAATAAAGASVQLTATVTPSSAVGSVTFYDGSTTLGTQTLTSGSAVLSTTTLSVGTTHSFVAIFTPTNSTATDPTAFKGSQSSAVAYSITAADTTTPTLTGPDGTPLSSNPTLTRGEVVTVQAGGFTPSESVAVVVHSTPETLTPATASSTGTVNYEFTVPSDLATGAHSLVLTGATSQKAVTINFSIASPAVLGTTTTSTPSAGSASLPFTGSNIELLAVIAMICTATGIAMRARRQDERYAGAHEWRRQH